MSAGDLDDLSLFDLFRMEAEDQVRVLQNQLLALEANPSAPASLEALMRAAHSLKGAARIVGLDSIVGLTHVMEDRFVAAQAGQPLNSTDVDRMLAATDWLARVQAVPESEVTAWFAENQSGIASLTAEFEQEQAISEDTVTPATPPIAPPTARPALKLDPEQDIFAQPTVADLQRRDRNVRVTTERLDEILALASETLVISRDVATHAVQFDRDRRALEHSLLLLEEFCASDAEPARIFKDLNRQAARWTLDIAELDRITRTMERISERLYRTVLAGRLRPFSEGIATAARLVRDTSRELGKSVRFEITGESTRVDRDILERLEAPISHLVTNALDHGIEPPAERIAAGKPAEASLRLRAGHENGRLVITLTDDGRGIDPSVLRQRIVDRGLVTPETGSGLSDRELLEFLFLPGFSTRDEVSTISGRGVGLNVVQSMVQEAGGSVVVTSAPGAGTTFRLTLPVTRAVIKVLRVQVEGEIYAVPLVRIDKVAHLEWLLTPSDTGNTRPEVVQGEDRLPVVSLGTLLGLAERPLPPGPLPLLLSSGIAFAVDRFVDEVELPVRRLDPRLGKIPGVSAASLDENGLPILILDMEDLVHTALGRPDSAPQDDSASHAARILIADDSHTVREMERRLLERAGYRVTAAQNGQEAWNLLRLNDYDLLISDVDMPQMNGIELVVKLRDNPRLGHMPVILLSYKDREEDRQRGLEAGADFYLTKGAFQNNTFLQAVVDLIGSGDLPSAVDGGEV